VAGFVYPFDFEHRVDGDELRALVGGKGAGLVEMTKLGIPVPPGFTIPTTACLSYLDSGWDDTMSAAVRDGIARVEAATGRRLGDPATPLLVSVRSGAAVSMPGMMDTVLNAGMTPDVAQGLETLSGNPNFAWDTYRRAIISFAQVVLETPAEVLATADAAAAAESAAATPRESAIAFAQAVAAAGYRVPADPYEQIEAATEAVFKSWHSARAAAYRQREGIDHGLGTAATVQAMVFGNMGERSGTGVAFSRNPSTGEAGLMGDFLVGAQGEDVVAGTHQTMPLSQLEALWPDVWAELSTVSDRLEHHSRDMVDLEFTVEDGRLWLLQTRRAKRSPAAVFRAAVEMANDADFPVDRAEAVQRCADHMDDPPRLANVERVDEAEDVIATGLAASPGRAVGVVSLDPDDAVEREQRGERVILVRQETSPADIHGMGASVGLVTTLGGMVSHAAVVARSWGLAAVVGCEGVELTDDAIVSGELRVEAGTTITVCGDSGQVLLGNRPSDSQPLPEVETIRAWARALDSEVADETAGSATVEPDDCLRLIVLKGMGMADGLADPLAAGEDAINQVMLYLADCGYIAELNNGRYRPTPEGIERVGELYATESAATEACNDLLEGDFHPPNMLLKEIITTWQMKEVDGEQVMNDHADADYDAAVIARLKNEVHTKATPIIARLTELVPRFARYQVRLDQSLVRLEGGDGQYMAHPMKDSYHTVWFEMHEEMIKIAGRDRASEAAAGRA
jgi:pyruvate,orthophosphate dikinase